MPFNRAHVADEDIQSVTRAMRDSTLCGNGAITAEVEEFIQERFGYHRVLMTPSCTDALELSALLLRLEPGDEVIVPSFTFVSTANAFALRGAKLRFADSCSNSPNVDPEAVRELINDRTKAVVVVHYGGICCDLERLRRYCDDAGIDLIEDAAQSLGSTVAGNYAGTFGRMATFSFHATKNIICGEGGAILLNNSSDIARAEILREKGTNRSKYLRGEVDFYEWVDVGSSFLASEITAAFLLSQIKRFDEIQRSRESSFDVYQELLGEKLHREGIETPSIPVGATANAHAFYVVLRSTDERARVQDTLRSKGVSTASHFLSLHRSKYFASQHDGKNLPNSDRYSECLLRLPLYYGLDVTELEYVSESLLAEVMQG